MSAPEPTGLQLTSRDLLILLIAFVCGTGAGLLLVWSSIPAGQAIIGGFVAAGGTFTMFDKIVRK
jgi:hypothetical protein